MDKTTIEELVEVKTKMMATTPEKLAEFGKGLLPDLDSTLSRAEVVMDIEDIYRVSLRRREQRINSRPWLLPLI